MSSLIELEDVSLLLGDPSNPKDLGKLNLSLNRCVLCRTASSLGHTEHHMIGLRLVEGCADSIDLLPVSEFQCCTPSPPCPPLPKLAT